MGPEIGGSKNFCEDKSKGCYLNQNVNGQYHYIYCSGSKDAIGESCKPEDPPRDGDGNPQRHCLITKNCDARNLEGDHCYATGMTPACYTTPT